MSSHRVRLLAAYFAIYFIWGSSFLAIHYAIETLPPLSMGGTRFLIGGAILYVLARLRGDARPQPANWRAAIVLGSMMVLIASGGTVWAQQRVSSGLTAVLATTVPLWIVLLDWLRPGGIRPDIRVAAGLLTGFGGVILLLGSGSGEGGKGADPLGVTVLLICGIAWAAGSLRARTARVSTSPTLTTAMQMLTGGVMLVVLGLAVGEGGRLDFASVSIASWVAMFYRLVGTVVAFTAYNWLLTVDTPSRVATYAYINPVVAVLLGWQIAGEEIGSSMIVGLVIILASVAVITIPRKRKRAVPLEHETAAAESASGG